MGKFIFGLAVAATAALTSLPTMAETYSAKTGMAIGSDLVLETKGSAHGPLLSVDIHVASQKELYPQQAAFWTRLGMSQVDPKPTYGR